MGNFKTFQRLFSYLKEHRLKLLFVILSAIISTGFMVLAPFLNRKKRHKLYWEALQTGAFYWEHHSLPISKFSCFIFHITTIYFFTRFSQRLKLLLK